MVQTAWHACLGGAPATVREANAVDHAIYAVIARTPMLSLDRERPQLFRAADHSTLWLGISEPGGRGFESRPRYQVSSATDRSVASGIVHLAVSQRVDAAVSDFTPRRGQLVRFSGAVGPGNPGAVAYIQRRVPASGRFRTIKRMHLLDAGLTSSVFTTHVRIRHTGLYAVRVARYNAQGYSGLIAIHVHMRVRTAHAGRLGDQELLPARCGRVVCGRGVARVRRVRRPRAGRSSTAPR